LKPGGYVRCGSMASNSPGGEHGDHEESMLEVVGRGGGGVEEMATFLRDEEVMWGLLRFELGSGSFARTKIVLLHFNGDDCPALRRSKLNALTGSVKSELRDGQDSTGFQACVQFNRRSEVSVESVLREASKCFIVDHVKEYTPAWGLQQYHDQIARERVSHERREAADSASQTQGKQAAPGAAAEAAEKAPAPQPKILHVPGQVYSKGGKSGREALAGVSKAGRGSWNWTLIGPDPQELPLLGGGSGSVDEMRLCAAQHMDLVMFGLIRLSFGIGRLQRTKFVFVHLIGSAVSVVQRGKYNTVTSAMVEAFKRHANTSLSIFDLAVDDLTLEDVIDRVRHFSIVDDDVIAEDGARRSLFSVEAFREALALELRAHDEPPSDESPPSTKASDNSNFGLFRQRTATSAVLDEEDASDGVENLDLAQTVRLVSTERTCNWALFRPKLARRPSITSLLPPSPMSSKV